ncbi:MAG: dialkylresorcinol condensing enzyme [Deltaproteobacteria bacterium]|nr:dialkylresorcinol condensing enzyme [Deltaproteobacteria bacterium]
MNRDKKRVLVLHYSQTGQLTRAARSMMAPLEGRGDIEVVWAEMRPATPYPFPWPFFAFLNVFPESVHMDAPRMRPLGILPGERFDLVILAYQVWFLSPALPITGFLKSEDARLLAGKPVITFIVCRNMWLTAQEKVKRLLAAAGARLIDNVVLVDQGHPLATFVTTPRWLWTGRKNGFWGVFPPAGVSEADINGAARFGRAIVDALTRAGGRLDASILHGMGAVRVNSGYVASERLAHRSFYVWGRLLRAIGPQESWLRKAMLLVYAVFLIVMILTLVPLGIVIRACLKPLIKKRLDAEVRRLEEPSGSGTERIEGYA